MQEDKYLEDEVDLREYIRVIVKRKWTIIIVVLISLGGGLLYNLLSTPIFQSQATLRIGKAEGILVSREEASELLRSKEIISSAIEGFPIDLSKLRIETENIRGTDLIQFKVLYPDSTLAMKACKVISESFLNKLKKIYDERINFLNERLKNLEKRKVSIQKKLEGLIQNISSQEPATNSLLLENILSNYENISSQLEESIYRLRERLLSFKEPQIFNLPSKPEPLKPKKKLVIAISIILGSFLGVFVAFFQEFWQREAKKTDFSEGKSLN